MIDAKKLEDIAQQITGAVPPGLKAMANDFDEKIKQILQAKLSQLDFVSREEFDVQTQVLVRTREKLTALEEKMAALEKQLEDK